MEWEHGGGRNRCVKADAQAWRGSFRDLYERVNFEAQGNTWHSQCIRSAVYADISMVVRGWRSDYTCWPRRLGQIMRRCSATANNRHRRHRCRHRRRAMAHIYIGPYYSCV